MMNLVALGLVFTSITTAGPFSPQQPKKNYERGENLLIKGHRLNVVEYEREGAAASNNNDKNDELRQGLFSESNSPGERIYDAFGRCKDKIAGAISKAKDVVSEGAHKVGEFHKASVLPNLGQGLSSESSSPGERIYDAFGRYNDKITGAFSKAKDVVSEGAHKVGEVGGAVLDMKKRALHKLGGSEAAANIASGVLETAKDKFHKASSILPNLGQGLSSESSSPGERIYDVFGRCKDKITGAFSKEKDVVSEGAHKVGEVGGAVQGLSSESSSPGEQIYDVFGRCKDKITGAFFKAKDVISEGAHKVGEVGRAVLDMKKRALHKPGDSANNNDKNDEPSLLEAKLDTESNIVSGVPETAKDNFHKASSILLNHGQGLYSESSSLGERIYYALGKSKDKIIGTFSKRKDIVSEGAHKVDEAGGASEESAIDKTKLMGQKIEEMGESTKEKTSEISYNIGDSEREKTNQLGEVGETAREKTRHKIGEVAESAKEKAGELEHKIGDSTKQVASGELLGPLLGVMHLLGFATTYGITVSVTFICSYVLAGTLPRQQFEIVQSKIYPVYFKALVGCIGCCLLAHVFTHWRKLDGESGRAERLQVYNLLASLGMVFFNLLYLEPRASKVMFDRMKMEKEEGRGRTVEGEEVIEATITTAATTTTTSTTESGGRGVTATTVETSDVLTSSGRVAEQEGIRSRSAELNQRLKKLNSNSFQQARRTAGYHPISKWCKIRRELKERFIPMNYDEVIFGKLQSLKMSISSLDDYTDQYYLIEVRVRLHETEQQRVSLVVDGMRESVIVTVQRVMQDEDEEEEETKMHTAYVHIRNGPSYLLYTTTTTATTIFIISGVQTMEGGSHNMVVEGRSLADTPTWFVASVTTVMVFLCLFAERSIYRFGKWLKKTRRKALHASLEKIKEELMLLGLISLMLGQWAKWISEICVDSSLFSSKLYLCSEEDYDEGNNAHVSTISSSMFSQLNHTSSNTSHTKEIAKQLPFHTCGKGREPFVSLEGLEQLHRFLFVLGITHVLYSCVAIGLAMIKIYSWRKWESQFRMVPEDNLQGERQCHYIFIETHIISHHLTLNNGKRHEICILTSY
ncbi:hypothetical protein GIB67_039395 [Kingdonia uniflora]|uniref:TMEM205-like domain-containing protein n=1 Tax=Kingdonia uniflora TaxID=39325 RepID=A0A7J7MBF2_9MAGN|nr:hypothetical protein GIB67_039395 [Kingdonia uniflora]